MDSKSYDKITGYVRDVCGISLGREKEYLVTQRLTPVMEKMGIADFDALAERMNTKFDTFLREQVIVAITTNETSFFRDLHPYQLLEEKLIPELVERVRDRKSRSFQRRGPKAAIWSSACSTGQEPYSIAIKIKDYLASRFISDVELDDFGILATDISSKVLAKAVRGAYSENELKRGLSDNDLIRHFDKNGNEWVAREQIRKVIDFKSLNLTESFTHIGSFDLIFCRNVLIYFEDAMKQKILGQMHEMLSPDGLLVLGAAESMYGLNLPFEHHEHKSSHFFRKKS